MSGEESPAARMDGGAAGSVTPRDQIPGGRTTVSMTWMTPLVASMSAVTTLAPPTVSPPAALAIGSEDPCSVAAEDTVRACAASTRPGTTWYWRIAYLHGGRSMADLCAFARSLVGPAERAGTAEGRESAR